MCVRFIFALLITATSFSVALGAMYRGAAATHKPSFENQTVIQKTNQHWPTRDMITVEPCAVRTCYTA